MTDITDRAGPILLAAALLGSVVIAHAQTPAATQPPGAGPGIFVDGMLNVPNAPADTSTRPAKFSARNDRLDRIPLMARGPQLSDAQRKLILDRVLAGSSTPARTTAGPTDALPASVAMQAWPADIAQQVPDLHDTKYVRLADKILVVRPENRIVIGEIDR
jgi:hypothetical protein